MSAREFLATVDDRITQIAAIGNDDPEHAHRLEDRLFVDALEAIRDGSGEEAVEIATRVHAVTELDYTRWYA